MVGCLMSVDQNTFNNEQLGMNTALWAVLFGVREGKTSETYFTPRINYLFRLMDSILVTTSSDENCFDRKAFCLL